MGNDMTNPPVVPLPPNDNIGVIVLGNTGMGKSTLIKICTGRDVRISNNHRRCTTNYLWHQSINDSNYYFLDTIGTNDIETSDGEIQNKIIQCLSQQNIQKIKIMLLVPGGDIRETADLTRIVQFIARLDTNVNKKILKSILVVRTRPEGNNSANIKSIFEREFNQQNINLPILDLGIIERYDDENRREMFSLLPMERRQRMGYYFENEVYLAVMTRITNMKKFRYFNKPAYCTTCGKRDDRRALETIRNCHNEFRRNKTTHLREFHVGQITDEHWGDKETTGSHFTLNYERRWTCCNRYHDCDKCHNHWSCCKRPPEGQCCRAELYDVWDPEQCVSCNNRRGVACNASGRGTHTIQEFPNLAENQVESEDEQQNGHNDA